MTPRGGDQGLKRASKGEKRRVVLNCRIDPATMKALEAEKKRTGQSFGKLIDKAIKKGL